MIIRGKYTFVMRFALVTTLVLGVRTSWSQLLIVRTLFLDHFRAEFEKIKRSKKKAELRPFHERLADLRFLEPACGCGNFLVVTYRELRLLELELLKELYRGQQVLDVLALSLLDVDAMLLQSRGVRHERRSYPRNPLARLGRVGRRQRLQCRHQRGELADAVIVDKNFRDDPDGPAAAGKMPV